MVRRNIFGKMSKIYSVGILLLSFILVMSSFKADKTRTVFMIGDSTMANKDISGDKQERGWGMMLMNYLDDAIVVDNHAVNGRSSKSFIDEGGWGKVLEKIMPGDYVIIQFGHNDEKKDSLRHTEPGSTFDENLRRFVRETRQKGGVPILMNSVVRRNFSGSATAVADDDLRDNSSKGLKEGEVLQDTHGEYLVSPYRVAKEMNVVFIDANKITHDLEQRLGVEGSKKLHMIFAPGETPSLPQGRQDNTHYNIYGADQVAHLLCKAICRELPELASHYQEYDVYVSRTGNGRYSDLQKAIENAPRDKKITIAITGGVWKKPKLSKRKNIELVLLRGAKFE